MSFFLPKIPIEFFKENKNTIAFVLVFTIAGFFVRSYVDISTETKMDCLKQRDQVESYYREKLDQMQRIVDVKDSTLNDLNNKLLISNGIIERLPEELEKKNKK